MPLDDCNESQLVSGSCGSPQDSTVDDDLEYTATEIDGFTKRFRNEPREVRNCRELRAVCIRCGSRASGTSFFKCHMRNCNETWRVNRCGKCKQPVDSRAPETPRCPKCGWLICAACNTCNCHHRLVVGCIALWVTLKILTHPMNDCHKMIIAAEAHALNKNVSPLWLYLLLK